jgi:cell division protease FtsH
MRTKAVLFLLPGLLLVSGVVGLIGYAGQQQPRSIPINDLAQLVEHGQIASIEVSGNVGVATTQQQQTFSVRVEQPGSLPGLLENFGVTSDQLRQVSYSVSNPVQLGDVLSAAGSLLPLLLIAGVVVFMVRRRGASGEAFNFGKARARVFDSDRPLTTFEDVAGIDEAKQELQEVVEVLKAPERFTALGARLPRGVLLVGPPGTGKTLIARAVAGEAGVPFFSISGSAFVEMFVGVGASRVRDLFDQAKRNAPSIIFVDELDAVGRRRGGGLGGSNDEREQTLNQILVEMDGFDARTNVIVIAATNRPDVLDQALLRPGRFDRQVQVPAPDIRGRETVLRVHARGKPVDASVDLVGLAGATPGFSGADLANVLNEAAILAARRRSSTIDGEDVEEAIDRGAGRTGR